MTLVGPNYSLLYANSFGKGLTKSNPEKVLTYGWVAKRYCSTQSLFVGLRGLVQARSVW